MYRAGAGVFGCSPGLVLGAREGCDDLCRPFCFCLLRGSTIINQKTRPRVPHSERENFNYLSREKKEMLQ